jgi:thiol-disulfide isomerase/thioredoxin
VKVRPVIVVLMICLLGMAVSAAIYLQGQKEISALFADELSVNSLNRLVEREETFLVYFYGRSCQDCVASEPYMLEAIWQLREDGRWPRGLPIYKCERETNATVRGLYGVEHTPTLLYFRAGEENARQEGPLPGVAEYDAFFSGLE